MKKFLVIIFLATLILAGCDFPSPEVYIEAMQNARKAVGLAELQVASFWKKAEKENKPLFRPVSCSAYDVNRCFVKEERWSGIELARHKVAGCPWEECFILDKEEPKQFPQGNCVWLIHKYVYIDFDNLCYKYQYSDERFLVNLCDPNCNYWGYANFDSDCIRWVSSTSPKDLARKYIVEERVYVCWNADLGYWIEPFN